MRVAVASVPPLQPQQRGGGGPLVRQQQQRERRIPRHRPSYLRILNFAYNWLLWGFFTILLYGQAFTIAWTRVTEHLHLLFGQNPALGVYQVLGTNDVPSTDRSFVCSLHGGRIYKPVQLQQALESSSAVIIDTSGSAINGYRMVKRSSDFRFSGSSMKGYGNICERIVSIMDEVLHRCEELGYNVAWDTLRIVVDDTLKLLPATLPVVAMPFLDNNPNTRYAIPGWDGSACLFRLSGAYETKGDPDLSFRGVDRTMRERKTKEWLQRPGGVWHNE